MTNCRLLRVAACVVVFVAGLWAPPSATRAAPVSPVEALLIGDSVMNGLAQSYGAPARSLLAARHSFLLDTAGCRRLITTSCHIGTAPAPTNAMIVLAGRAGQFNGAVVIAAGYNDPSTGSLGIGAAVDTIVAQARGQGVPRVIWLTYREAGTAGDIARFRAHNAVLLAKLAVYPELELADWNTRSFTLATSAFSSDGIHLGASAAIAMADLIAGALDRRVAPGTPIAPDRCAAATWAGTDAPGTAPSTATSQSGGVHILPEAVRLVDTRNGSGKLGATRLLTVPVAGANGVSAAAVAAIVTVTSVEPCGQGFLAIFPCGGGVPLTSVLNAAVGTVVANSAVVGLGGGALCVYASQPTDVLVDLTGWIGAAGSSTTPAAALRLVDSRPGRAQALPVAQQRLHARQLLAVDVAAQPAVGPDATAVTVNITAATPIGAGYLTVLPGPCDPGAYAGERPKTSSLNVASGRDAAASATVGIGGGQICVYSSVDTDVIVDLQSVHHGGQGNLVAISPQRLIDTRPSQRLVAGATVVVDLAGLASVSPVALTAVMVNLTAVDPGGRGFLVVYACGLTERPLVSNLNVVAATTVANRALVATAGGQTLCVYSSVDTDIVIDVEALIT